MGTMDLLPAGMQTTLKEAEEATAHIDGILVNVAIGYGGLEEIALRGPLDAARGGREGDLGRGAGRGRRHRHDRPDLYTGDQPDPDLVIRTSGEQRLSGFMLWQTAHSEYYFCDVFWPAFRKVDFLRALRDYPARHRRYGG
ncbi:Isoprenyl transferase OS=Streptomyces glaucescens OX=1907 GN=uppS PE=3 SV=1 [Streptomyces glaucescens]